MTSKLTITDERMAELVAFRPLPGTDINSATRDEWMAMAAELQERRKADSEPVAWLWSRDDERDVSLTPPEDDDDAADAIECGWTATPLYRHAQQPVVPDEKDKTVDADDHPLLWSFNEGWNACRAAMLAAATQSPGSEPATVPGKWIPVSERMPEDEQEVLTINKMGHRFVSFFDKHSGLFFDRLNAPAACCIEHVLVTHWMQLPAGPQEVK